MFRTRQAPSPTGYLHLGTARQILFTILFAKKNQGQWYLRLEDTDQKRLNKDSAKMLLEVLKEMDLLPPEGVTLFDSNQQDNQKNTNFNEFYQIYETGDFKPYIQSQRLDLYHQNAQKLIDKELAYWCYLSEQEKQEMLELKNINKKPIDYYKANTLKDTSEKLYQSVTEGLKDFRKPVLRYRLQRNQKIDCYDELLGKTTFDLNLEEDFIILKSDGFPTYHLAHLVDDYLMQTTLVIRAQEWYSSLARHTVMFLDYWGKVPKYIHLPFILGETGNKKLSKRDGKADMRDYLSDGYLPEAIINYLAFLGFNPGTEKELYLQESDFK
jgi:glutamyl-tRNA synthetase